ncbi:6-carboxytetrahydropterin synthase [Aliikangiella coralliicola]|uniref:6-carboxy-5,6,7,8-tetrahydropterin synthase n=1 Tax=Aliikangiella coralliicola TaxID=2592383 RepID=A0A545UAQ1_9GAMM|nr:6-carboxytetrahydropterin synthase [Aliikangiella coralliicola]TQV86537.1 6-pyruvoyl tetrahydropterin reductase [Aliikangiella coralliicola]
MQALFVDNLTVIDFAYFHPERGIVGESLILDVTLFGELNDEGMLFDFSFVKKRIKSCVDSLVDHKFLVAKQQAEIEISESPQHLNITLKSTTGDYYEHISPHEAVYFVDAESVTPETISTAINSEIMEILPDNVKKLTLGLRAEDIQKDFYHYSHGLKKHFGDCQRIAHGHRSKIEVWENEHYAPDWTSHIAEIWRDIYLATEEDIQDTKIINGQKYYVFRYHANQGMFQLTIPQNDCHIIQTDTTVELIADYLANYLKAKKPDSNFKVKAYEGVDKGAIVSV